MIPWRWWGLIVALSLAVGFALTVLVGSYVGWVTAAVAGAGLMVVPEKQRTAKNVVLTFLLVAAASTVFYYARIRHFR